MDFRCWGFNHEAGIDNFHGVSHSLDVCAFPDIVSSRVGNDIIESGKLIRHVLILFMTGVFDSGIAHLILTLDTL